MLVAKSENLGRVFSGPEVQTLIDENHHTVFTQGFTCPSCGREVLCVEDPSDQQDDYFVHADGSVDCFHSDSTSDEHRVAIEITLKELHNRIREVTGKPVAIDAERWIGERHDFVTTDVRVTSPLQVAVEVFYKADRLALGRRLETMFANGYNTYLIFRMDGCHEVDRIERYIRRVAPLSVGRFEPATLELAFGDLFSEQQIDLNAANRDLLPNYIAYSNDRTSI